MKRVSNKFRPITRSQELSLEYKNLKGSHKHILAFQIHNSFNKAKLIAILMEMINRNIINVNYLENFYKKNKDIITIKLLKW